MTSTLEEAVTWLARGVAVLPIWPGQKTPALSSWGNYKTRLPELTDLINWFRYPRNLAVVTGWNGLTVLDFDSMDLFCDWFSRFGTETLYIQTSRGVHAYFWVRQPVMPSKHEGLDVIHGGYVLAPPSIHPSGAAYTVLGPWEIAHIERVDPFLPDPPLPPYVVAPLPEITMPARLVSSGTVMIDPFTWAGMTETERTARKVEEIKSHVSILDLIGHSPSRVDKRTGYLWVHCPIHDDQNASMVINPQTGDAKCFAGCNGGRWMDAIVVYSLMAGMVRGKAIDDLFESLVNDDHL